MTTSPQDLTAWRARITRPAGPLGNASRAVQRRINTLIPEKVHAAITAAMSGMTKAILTGADFTTASPLLGASLEDREAKVTAAIDGWKTAAGAEGGAAGLGGFALALADFPLLMSFKFKLLAQIAALYGHDGRVLSERLYMLHIFELAFSDVEHRIKVLAAMDDWDAAEHPADLKDFDWRSFQQQYRDHIDLAKLAQMLPVVGAPVGAVVNWRLTAHLGKTAMMAYRMRWLATRQGEVVPAR
ncbi:EcsC family protein [Caulobacter sp. DWP3-1-3b2]|uniref:EcsC family protein n=1 Tax=Caulobacter sp. DWP3-1-3b2 TaxID=2804643 RepID=UPI003CF8A10C